MRKMQVHVGTSGYSYKDWEKAFYHDTPRDKWLSFYGSRFDTVEINATFYRSFPGGIFTKWRNETLSFLVSEVITELVSS